VGEPAVSHFPILISDWSMPEIDGPSCVPDACARHRQVFLLPPGHGDGGKKRYLEGMEAAPTISSQPIDMDELRARLKAAERILGLRQHVQQLEGLLPICAYCQTHAATPRKVGIERTLCGGAIRRAVQSRLLSDCYEKARAPQLEKP